MEITRTRDVNVIRYIKPIISKFIEFAKIEDFDATKFLQHLRRALQSPNYIVWVSSENNEINGIAVGTIQSSIKGDYLMLPCFFSEKEEIEKMLIDSIIEWAKESSLSEIVTMTKFPKKFKNIGFDVKEHLLVRTIT